MGSPATECPCDRVSRPPNAAEVVNLTDKQPPQNSPAFRRQNVPVTKRPNGKTSQRPSVPTTERPTVPATDTLWGRYGVFIES